MAGADPTRRYVSNEDRPVFALRGLPEEVIAVLFAYYSRSPHSLRDNLRRLLAEGDLAIDPEPEANDEVSTEADLVAAQERARAFHEKWVVGYGHSSVAEHAVVHLAVEQISIIASKAIEDARLASFTEKSTRYVPFDGESFVREPAIKAGPLAERYEDTCRHLLTTYASLLPRLEDAVRSRLPRPEDWTQARYDSVCRARACDSARYLLPTATRTNLGLTINARALEHLLTKLYSSDLSELRRLAADLHAEATSITPTLIKYAAPNDYLRSRGERVAELAAQLAPPTKDGGRAVPSNGVLLVEAPTEPLAELATSLLYEHSQRDWRALRAEVATWSEDQMKAVIDGHLAGRGRFDAPGRALERLALTFEVTLDYGAWRDIQRHRLCTQLGGPLDTRLGFESPPDLDLVSGADEFHAAMALSADTHGLLAAEHGLEAAQYVLPLAWRKRLLLTMNLRELHHFVSLRSARQGHASYRRIAQGCWRELERYCPALAAGVRVDLADYDLARG